MLRLPDSWVWDSWLADDGDRFHLFFLFASRALQDPERRHARAAIGHAVSVDLRSWTRVADALVPDPAPAFDDTATWTGSVVRAPDGDWLLFYTGVTLDAGGRLLQSIGLATSPDLLTWQRHPGNPIVAADPRWYEHRDGPAGCDEAWRDPWVFPDPAGDGWHMLLTAHAKDGPDGERGVIGHATSPDLVSWTVRPPLNLPGHGFSHLEVPQLATVDGRDVLLFSCLPDHCTPGRRASSGPAGIWTLPVPSFPPTPPSGLDTDSAVPLTDETLYAGHLVRDRTGAEVLVAFRNESADGFVGAISDPRPVRWSGDGVLTLGAQG